MTHPSKSALTPIPVATPVATSGGISVATLGSVLLTSILLSVLSVLSVFSIISIISILPSFPASARAEEPAPLLPSAETEEQRSARLSWWREARFGLFIHWGPASLSGTEISWSRIGHPHDHPGLESVPPEVYDKLYLRFDPVKFDADAWMSLAREAGMKYVVFTAKHHDGFSMWPTRLRPPSRPRPSRAIL